MTVSHVNIRERPAWDDQAEAAEDALQERRQILCTVHRKQAERQDQRQPRRDEDDLGAARGIAHAAVIGSLIWAVIAIAAWWW